jgi:hypothetical protein
MPVAQAADEVPATTCGAERVGECSNCTALASDSPVLGWSSASALLLRNGRAHARRSDRIPPRDVGFICRCLCSAKRGEPARIAAEFLKSKNLPLQNAATALQNACAEKRRGSDAGERAALNRILERSGQDLGFAGVAFIRRQVEPVFQSLPDRDSTRCGIDRALPRAKCWRHQADRAFRVPP